MNIANPYRPGAGLMPGFLAGREEIIENAKKSFEALGDMIPIRSIAYVGYRGVGKTVLLNRLQEIAEDEYEIRGYHIEVAKSGSFIAKLSDSCRKYLRGSSLTEMTKGLLEKAIDALKALEITYNPDSNAFSVSAQERALYVSEDLAQGLQELIESIGEIAYKKRLPVCFFIDEFQYSSQEEMDAFISAIHRANQLSYPIMAVCAGTPELIRMLYNEKTYVERLFLFPTLGLLSESQVGDALEIPGEKVGLKFSKQASSFIWEKTSGYPYFVQQYGQIICDNCEQGEEVSEDTVKSLLGKYYDELDTNFYMVRFEERGALEKECMIAMAQADSLPCEVSLIAKRLEKSVKQIAPTLSRLKNKGLIKYDNIKEIDFTVPGFDGYINRHYNTATI